LPIRGSRVSLVAAPGWLAGLVVLVAIKLALVLRAHLKEHRV
jgi:hypothetical protein